MNIARFLYHTDLHKSTLSPIFTVLMSSLINSVIKQYCRTGNDLFADDDNDHICRRTMFADELCLHFPMHFTNFADDKV